MNLQDIVSLLERKALAPGGQQAVARTLGISSAYLSDIIGGKRQPGKKVLNALGLECVVTYRRKAKQ